MSHGVCGTEEQAAVRCLELTAVVVRIFRYGINHVSTNRGILALAALAEAGPFILLIIRAELGFPLYFIITWSSLMQVSPTMG